MRDDGVAASVAGGGPVRRQRAKPAKETKRSAAETARLQLHLDHRTVKRLGVHCAMRGTSWSAEAERILLRYLVKEGMGRELFKETDASLAVDESAA
jgi:hypothetical protein